MADELRELVATVDFDFDLDGLLSMDDTITESEHHLRELGAQIDATSDLVSQLGRTGTDSLAGIRDASQRAGGGLEDLAERGRRSVDEMADASDRAADDLGGVGDAAGRAARDVRNGSRRASRELDNLGEAGQDAAGDIGDAAGRAERDLRDLGNAGDRAGDRIRDAAGDAERDLRDMGRAGDRAGDDIADASRRAEDRLRDLGNAGDRAGGDIRDAAGRAERDLRDLGNAGDRAGDRIRDAGRRAGDGLNDIGDQSRRAGDDLGDLTRRGQDRLNNLGDAGGGAGDRIRDAARDAGGGLADLIPGLSNVIAWFDKFKLNGVAAVVAITAAITFGLLVAIGKIADEMDVVNDRMSATLGATTQETEDMRKAALNLYKDGFGESYADIGDGIAVIKGTFRDLNEQELTQTAEKMAIIGDLWQKETTELTRATSVFTKSFDGLSESDALDLITTGFQQGGPGAEDLLDTISEYSVYFAAAGQSAEGFIGSLVKGMKAGARNTDVVADAFKEFGIITTDIGSNAPAAFESLGFDADKMMAAIAGGGDKAKSAFDAATAALSMVKNPLEQNTLGVQLFGTKWEDLRDQIILSMNHGEDAVKGFQGATDRAGEQLFDNWDSKWKQFTRTIKGTFMGIIDDSGFAESLTSMGQGLVDALPAITAGINTFLGWLRDAFGSAGVDLGAMLDSVVAVCQSVGAVLAAIWLWVGPLIVDTLGATLGTIGAILTGAFNLIADVFNIFAALFTGDWGGLWESTKSLFSNLWNAIIAILRGVLNIFTAIWENAFVRLWNFLADMGVKIYEGGKDLVMGLIRGVKEFGPQVGEAIVKVASDMWNGFKSFFGINSPSKLMSQAGQWIIEGLKNGVMDRAKDAIAAVKNVAKDMWNGVKDFFGIASPSKLMIEAGGFVVEGMEVGISDTASQAIGAAHDMSKGIADAATAFKPQDAASAVSKDTSAVAESKVVDLAAYRGAKVAESAKDSPEVVAMTMKPKERDRQADVIPLRQTQNGPGYDSRPVIQIGQIVVPVTVQAGAGGSTVDEEAIKEGARIAATKGINAAIEEYFKSLSTAIGE